MPKQGKKVGKPEHDESDLIIYAVETISVSGLDKEYIVDDFQQSISKFSEALNMKSYKLQNIRNTGRPYQNNHNRVLTLTGLTQDQVLDKN